MSILVTRLASPEEKPSPSTALAARLKDLDEVATRVRIECMMPVADCEWLSNHIGRFRKELWALEKTSHQRGNSRCRKRVERILHSFSAKVTSVAFVIVHSGRYEGINPHDLSKGKLDELANLVNVYESLLGFARLVRQPKANGEIRPTLHFSGNVRSAQFLVASVLETLLPDSRIDFARRGLGTSSAIQQIGSAICDGYRDWLTFDLKHNFPSVRRKHLQWLPLPEEVISNVVFVNRYIAITNMNEDDEGIKQAVRQGLPQGAALSGLIASALLERKLRHVVGGDCRMISYVDDVGIGARNRCQIAKTAKAIKSSFENDPAGPLTFSRFEINSATEGIEMLGWAISLTEWDGKPKVWKRPSDQSWRRFQKRLRDKFSEPMTYDEREAVAIAYAEVWARSFGDWWQEPFAHSYLMNVAAVEAGDHPDGNRSFRPRWDCLGQES